jgi:hypothetical protein
MTIVRPATRADLLKALGFREVTRDFTVPGVWMPGGAGILCRARLPVASGDRRSLSVPA